MVVLTNFWVKVERLNWLLYFWGVLMIGGVILTDLSIFLGWGNVLIRLCPLGLGLWFPVPCSLISTVNFNCVHLLI
ncbi:hypothetical protein [Coleofasciculus sp. F4-SAH-05]|uniref:hypothetical protein n=1 Tax=Coleofasciculus sp. F4-SAH-05 TaxID=3069525 RepID=UPI0033039C44